MITITEAAPILAHAPHVNAAKVFVNWLLTERGQGLWHDLGQVPLRADIPPTDAWMQGVGNAKQVFENTMAADEQEASYKAAAADFKS